MIISRVAAEWPELKQKEAPFGQLPIFRENGKIYAQSKAIIRHLARVLNRYGSNEEEHFLADMYADLCGDWRRDYSAMAYSGEQYEAARKKYDETQLPRYITLFNKALENKDYLLGSNICFADYILWELVDINLKINEKLLENAPALAAFHKRVAERPNIAKYIQEGNLNIPVNGAMAAISNR